MNRCINTVILSSFLLLLCCESDTFITNLENTSLKTQEATSTNFKFKSYQIPPSVGGLQFIYLGNKEGYEASRTLVEFESHEILRWANFQVDSGHFQFTLDTNYTMDNDIESSFTLGYFRRDSNYAESISNYSNVGWINDGYPKLSSSVITDSSGLKHLFFMADSTIVQNLADTTDGSWLYILESTQINNNMLRFYSSNSPVNKPLFRAFMHQDTSSSDTSNSLDSTRIFEALSDVTLFVPPALSSDSFDSSFSYIGVASGLATIVKPDLFMLDIPKEASIARAKLILQVDRQSSYHSNLDSLLFQAYAMEDTILDWSWGEILKEDSYSHHTGTIARSLSSSPIESILKLDVTEILQSIISERESDEKIVADLGLKLKIINSKTIFDYIAIKQDSSGLGQPKLEVLFEIP